MRLNRPPWFAPLSALFCAALALGTLAVNRPQAQQPGFPQTMPANTVYGRTAITSGPGQAIPMGTLFGLLFNSSSSPTAHAVLLGEGSSALGTATIGTAGRALLDQGASADPAFTAMSGDATQAGSGAVTIAAAAVTNAKLATATNLTFKCNVSGGTASPSDCVGGNFAAIACVPDIQVKTSGSSATYMVPTCNSVLPAYIEIEMVGSGGGGASSGTSGNSGTTGNASTFIFNSVTYTANGGANGVTGIGAGNAAGGTATGCDDNITGAAGGSSPAASTINNVGTDGGSSPYGGAGRGSTGTTTAGSAAANTGSGGGAGGTSGTVPGAGSGAAGGFCRKTIAVGAVTTGTYTIGAAAAGGTPAGTSGGIGGAGAVGRLKVTARWQ